MIFKKCFIKADLKIKLGSPIDAANFRKSIKKIKNRKYVPQVDKEFDKEGLSKLSAHYMHIIVCIRSETFTQ